MQTAAARRSLVSKPAKAHFPTPDGNTAQRPLGGAVGRAQTAVIEEAGPAVQSYEHQADDLRSTARSRSSIQHLGVDHRRGGLGTLSSTFGALTARKG